MTATALRFISRGSLMAACALLPALALPQESPRKPVRSLLEIRQEGVVIQKWDLSCGAAALATVLTFALNDPVTERTVAARMLVGTNPEKVRKQGGFSMLDMKKFVEARGYRGIGYKDLDIDELMKFFYPIVPIGTYGADAHFVVVTGRLADGRMQIADPSFGNRQMTVEQFAAVWQDGIGFIVTGAP